MVLRRLQALTRLWRNKRQLKKLGYESWRQYRRHTDPDVFFRADRVNDYFHGYQYVHCFENHQHQIYLFFHIYQPGLLLKVLVGPGHRRQ